MVSDASNLLLLAQRRWKTAVRSHLAAVIIAAAVITAWLLYWGYLEHAHSSLSGRVRTADFPADFAITLPPGTQHSVPGENADIVQIYQTLTVETPLGLQSLAAVYSQGADAPLPNPEQGEVWLAGTVKLSAGIEVGSPFQIAFLEDWRYRVFAGRVAGFYSAHGFCPEVTVNGYWLSDNGVILDANEVTLYRWLPNSTRWAGHLPAGATMQTAAAVTDLAGKVVSTAFAGGGSGVWLLYLFLTLGAGTFSLLSYLDSRRELALLKAMGLSPREVSGLFLLEGLFTGLISFGLTLGVTLLIDRKTSLPVTLTGSMIWRALTLGGTALAVATAVPYILARAASVNELLFGRPVPLLRRFVAESHRNYPALASLAAAGHTLVKLPIIDGGFPGICLCRAGQRVKAGQTVAWMASVWGLIEHHYLAPCDGEIIQADLAAGLLVIQPY